MRGTAADPELEEDESIERGLGGTRLDLKWMKQVRSALWTPRLNARVGCCTTAQMSGPQTPSNSYVRIEKRTRRGLLDGCWTGRLGNSSRRDTASRKHSYPQPKARSKPRQNDDEVWNITESQEWKGGDQINSAGPGKTIAQRRTETVPAGSCGVSRGRQRAIGRVEHCSPDSRAVLKGRVHEARGVAVEGWGRWRSTRRNVVWCRCDKESAMQQAGGGPWLMDEKGSVGLVKARAVREGFKVPHVAPTKCCIENNPPNHFHSTVASEQEAATIQKSSRGREKDVRHRVDAVAK